MVTRACYIIKQIVIFCTCRQLESGRHQPLTVIEATCGEVLLRPHALRVRAQVQTQKVAVCDARTNVPATYSLPVHSNVYYRRALDIALRYGIDDPNDVQGRHNGVPISALPSRERCSRWDCPVCRRTRYRRLFLTVRTAAPEGSMTFANRQDDSSGVIPASHFVCVSDGDLRMMWRVRHGNQRS